MDRKFKKSVLKNGIRVVSEFHPESRAVAIGAWVDVGTRDESIDQVGISHLLEHMVFKGTKTRTSYQISKSLEALGGELNAFTGRENTCYHALVLKDHWGEALDVLTDLICNMKFTKKDFMLEKGVILQEIAMAEESPEEYVYDHFFEYCFGKHPLGRSILGNLRTITHMKMGEVHAHYKDKYQGSNILISAAGNIDHEELVQKADQLLAKKKKRKPTARKEKPRWDAHRWIKEKDTEQVHFLVGLPFPSFQSPDRFAGVILNAVLGGGMTSRLYQSIRERRGLAYSIYSMMNSFVDSGVLNIYAGIDPDKIEELAELVTHELKKLKKQGLKKSEVENYKTQVVGSLLLGADDVDNRMNSIAINELVFGEYRSPEDVVAEVEKVTSDKLHEFIDHWIKPEKIAGVLMGPSLSNKQEWWENWEFT
jgi:predicted Zn-dependent peptidase